MPHTLARPSVRALLCAALLVLLTLAAAPAAFAQTDANWSTSFGYSGTDGEVLCSVMWNGKLVVGGSFGTAGTLGASQVAVWDGTSWSALGAGFDGTVEALAVWNGSLYAGGLFTTSGGTSLSGVARWNGTAWVSVGGGTNGEVKALLATPSGLVVGGGFDNAQSVPNTGYVARWNGTAWSALGGGLDATVHGLALHNSQVAAVGEFNNYVSIFNGSSWNTVGGGIPDGTNPSALNAVISHGGMLYVGGNFDPVVNGNTLLNVAAWDGSQWQPLSGGVDNTVQGFAEWNGKLLLAGMFYNPLFHVGLWDGDNFEHLDGNWFVGMYGGDYVNTATVSGTTLYLGGVINEVWPSAYGNNVFAYNGTTFTSLGAGNGLNGAVGRITKWNGSIVVGGSFGQSMSTAGLNGVARWTGTAWAPLGTGLQTSGYYQLRVDGLTPFGTDLVVTGQFSSAGGATAGNVARWNGSTWNTMAGGFDSEVFQGAVYNNELWVVGAYHELQANTVGSLWKWTGSAWQSMATNITGFALTVWNGKLVVGGAFSSIAGVPANCVAQWDGSHWTALGSGLNAAVVSLAVYNNELYATGEFNASGTNPVSGIAHWNGTQWVPVGGAIVSNFFAHALASGSGSLWTGGSWDHIGSTTGLNNVARWDGSAWNPLGSGIRGYVNAIYVDGTDVWVGGNIYTAGQKTSLYVGKWSSSVTAVPGPAQAAFALALKAPSPNPSHGLSRIEFSLPGRGDARLDIVDVLGRRVASVLGGTLDAGPHAATWDGRTSGGSRAAAGVYFAVLRAGGRQASTRLVRVE